MVYRWRLVAALLVTSGCTDSNPSGPVPALDDALVENHPSPVTTAYNWTSVAWSGDGRELAYVRGDSATAVAYNLATGATRVIYAAAPQYIYQVMLSADGKEAFTVSGPDSPQGRPGQSPATIRRHTASGAQVLTDRHVATTSPLYMEAVKTGANGTFAYIVGNDSLFVVVPGSAARFVGTTCFSIVAISSDGGRVICYSSSHFIYLLTGSRTDLVPSDPGAGIRDVVWNAAGIFLVTDPSPPVCLFIVCNRGSERYAFERHGDPATKFLTPQYTLPETTSSVSLAEDGRSFAYVNHYCANRTDSVSCGKQQNTFYIADGVARTTRRVAVHNSVMSLAISPDGSRLAYVAGGQLYILPTT